MAALNEQILITTDRAHLKVFEERTQPGQHAPSLVALTAIDFPAGKQHYTDNESDAAGRFPTSRGRNTGMSTDERLPLKEEHDRRLIDEIAAQINALLLTRPAARWRLAAPAPLQARLLSLIDDGVKARLTAVVAKDLIHTPTQELLEHFAAASSPTSR